MSEDDCEALFYVTKDEFIKRMLKMNTDWTKLAIRYATQLQNAKTENDAKWFQKEMEELSDDIKHNNEMVVRAKIEAGYNLFWIDGGGNLSMRRCSKEEHDNVYKPHKKPDYIL